MNTAHWKFLAAAASALAVGLPGAALAATSSQTEQAEISHLQNAKVSPQQAIQAAEKAANGRAVAYGYEVNGNTNAYEVTLASAGNLKVVQVDPTSGKVLSNKSEASDSLSGDGLPGSAIGQANNAQVSLLNALQSVQQQANGPALEAGYVMRQGQLGIDVDVAANGSIKSYMVDPQSGSVPMANASETESQEGQGGQSTQDSD